MCELFALSGREPATATLSLDVLAAHGGGTGPHADGWGVAFYDDRDIRVVRDPQAASDSACLRFIREHAFSSTVVVAHIRKATRGGVCLANTQPFAREVGGRMQVFAHNGDLPGVEEHPDLRLDVDRPIGTTDSEYAFCALLSHLRPLWRNASVPPSVSQRLGALASFARTIAPLGPANFIFADGDTIFAHGHRRTQADGVVRPPGLYHLRRSCPLPHRIDVPGLTVESSRTPQEVTLIASVPLTDESWTPFGEGEVLAMTGGRIVARVRPRRSDARPDATSVS